ncbi:sensor protein PilS [Microbulbifer flavimaris]|uniref:histidine kinase n=1 Tax=Microbulbifer flavimaris TaxID=1781068 RepID=A0ABX4HVN2_9GAMM|nr:MULTISPECIES: ATP-binding protein [Microbulbifer]KUJ79641.1 sensor protein PilS [Microbulbifer sp. ZGT114]PCO04167.1 sensor protein PilS [Microbulbifer flavimaris]
MSSTASTASGLTLQHHELLRIYAYYRVAIALILLGIFNSEFGRGAVGNSAPALYLKTVVAYCALNLGWLVYLRHNHYRTNAGQVGVILGCDILAFLVLIQSSGGLNSGLGYLLLINCSVGSMLLDRRMGAFFAAVASMAVIGQQLYGLLAGIADTQDIVAAGSLGILLFATVSALQYLSGRIRSATLRADQQSRQAAHLQRLAQQIVERMRTGVLVLDSANKPELVNRAAQQLLGERLRNGESGQSELGKLVRDWRMDPGRGNPLLPTENGGDLRLNLTSLPREHGDSTLMFVEDNRKLAEAAQKLKLASLGHLTGSIAHEVRNPLGAISHAAQLLSESPGLNQEDRHLVDIICRHSLRVNQIVENVMQLSRRQPAEPRLQDLALWTEQFVADFRAGAPADTVIELELPADEIPARFDAHQLGQIATNLCNNALHHSKLNSGRRWLGVEVYRHPQSDCPVLDISDLGAGVPAENLELIFEPFFTTGQGGSGLGLYIARELGEANQINLHHCRDHHGRSCFRAEFAPADSPVH